MTRWPVTVRRKTLPAGIATVLGAVLWASALTAGEPGTATPVRDLYYGESLFHFYQDRHFDALTRLLTARAAGRVPHHEGESELLLGGLYLHYGQHVRAEEIFSRLLTSAVSASVRDRAWFYLGKVRYQRGLHDEALAAFARVSGELPDSLSAELPMLKAQALMALERFDEAATLLDGWKGPAGWLPFARYNLGVAFVRLGRLADGARQLDRVGQGRADTAELLNLRDKANLALGYAYLQESRDGEARPVLERVRLQSPFASKALLGVGWAAAATGDYRTALTPWLELRGRDLLDSAVQESLLAIPYAYARLDAHGSAAEGYQNALGAFDAEIRRLDDTLARTRSGSFINAVLEADDASIGRWYWELDAVPDTSEARYLYLLMADHRFQEGLRNVRDLAALSAHLQEWQDKLAAFGEIVDTRRVAYEQREPVVRAGLDQVDVDRLLARREALASRLGHIAASRDVTGLATDDELDRWQRVAALGEHPGFSAPGGGDLRERYRLLRGVQLWDLDREYKYRLWRQQQSLVALDDALAVTRGRLGSTDHARQGTPAELAGFAARIAGLEPRIERLQQALRLTRNRQEERLQALVTETLQEQRERLAAYRIQAQFALATIYDRAATAARVNPEPRP